MSMVDDFWAALGAGDEARVRELVRADPSLASARTPQGHSAVLAAAYGGHAGVARALADEGAPLTLFEAAVVGDAARVEAALAADPEGARAFSPDGFTALHLSVFFGQPAVMRLLLDRGAEVNVTANNSMKVRPIHSAAAFRDEGRGLEMVTALVEAGAELNVAQEGGWTPLHQAAAHGEARLVEYLLRHGADPAARSADGRLPADMAEGSGHAEAAAALRAAAATVP